MQFHEQVEVENMDNHILIQWSKAILFGKRTEGIRSHNAWICA